MAYEPPQERPVPADVSAEVERLANEPGGLTDEQADNFAAYLRAHTPEQLALREKQGLTMYDWLREKVRLMHGVDGHRLLLDDREAIVCAYCTQQAVFSFYDRGTSPGGRAIIRFIYVCDPCADTYFEKIAKARLRAETEGDTA